MYLQTIKKYNKNEQQVFPRLCAIVISALQEDPDRDFLGELYMALELGSHWKGQFFTPYAVCKAMADITSEDLLDEVKCKGFIPVNDPASGAGATLIAYANTAKKKLGDAGLNFQNHILFTAQDIDTVTGLMCYIQLSLMGCAGYVKIGDTLINPMTECETKIALNDKDKVDYWFTPMYFSKVWHYRRLFRSMDNFFGKGVAQCKMKQLARENMAVNDIKTLNPYTVDTVAAFAAWGLDISKLEKNYKKLQELKLEV